MYPSMNTTTSTTFNRTSMELKRSAVGAVGADFGVF